MVRAAPRIDRRLLDALERLDDGTAPIAEVCRRLGAEADASGLTQPSYESVRELVHVLRELRSRKLGPSALRILWEAGAGIRGGYGATVEHIARPREERR
jgi:hypothetical protein